MLQVCVLVCSKVYTGLRFAKLQGDCLSAVILVASRAHEEPALGIQEYTGCQRPVDVLQTRNRNMLCEKRAAVSEIYKIVVQTSASVFQTLEMLLFQKCEVVAHLPPLLPGGFCKVGVYHARKWFVKKLC